MFIPFGESLVNADRVDFFEFVVMCESKTGGGAVKGPVKIASLLASQAPELIQGSPDQVSKKLSRLFADRLDGRKPYLECRAYTSSKAVCTESLDEMRALFGS
jgi:hypothetical protein